MHDPVIDEKVLFRSLAAKHVEQGGALRLQSRHNDDHYMVFKNPADDAYLVIGGDAVPQRYAFALPACEALMNKARLIGLTMIEIEFTTQDKGVGVTWRHLSARLDVLRMLLKNDPTVMQRVLEEAEAWRP